MALRKRKRNTQGGLEDAQKSLERARRQHKEQAAKRKQEQAGVIKKIERAYENNHLVALVWDVISGDGGT